MLQVWPKTKKKKLIIQLLRSLPFWPSSDSVIIAMWPYSATNYQWDRSIFASFRISARLGRLLFCEKPIQIFPFFGRQGGVWGGRQAHGRQKFQGQGSNRHHSSNPSHSSDNTRSLTQWATGNASHSCSSNSAPGLRISTYCRRGHKKRKVKNMQTTSSFPC